MYHGPHFLYACHLLNASVDYAILRIHIIAVPFALFSCTFCIPFTVCYIPIAFVCYTVYFKYSIITQFPHLVPPPPPPDKHYGMPSCEISSPGFSIRKKRSSIMPVGRLRKCGIIATTLLIDLIHTTTTSSENIEDNLRSELSGRE